jgi:hypothetical protein
VIAWPCEELVIESAIDLITVLMYGRGALQLRAKERTRSRGEHVAREGRERRYNFFGLDIAYRDGSSLAEDAVLIEPVSAFKFPANREINREFRRIRRSSCDFGAQSAGEFNSFQANSLLNETGNLLNGTGFFFERTGKSKPNAYSPGRPPDADDMLPRTR